MSLSPELKACPLPLIRKGMPTPMQLLAQAGFSPQPAHADQYTSTPGDPPLPCFEPSKAVDMTSQGFNELNFPPSPHSFRPQDMQQVKCNPPCAAKLYSFLA
jgi:hypothetical protein